MAVLAQGSCQRAFKADQIVFLTSFSALRSCDHVTLWLCDFVTLWLCDFVSLWLCDHMTLWRCDNVILWLCDCNDLTTSLHSFAVSSVTKFPTDCTSIERHSVFLGFCLVDSILLCVCIFLIYSKTLQTGTSGVNPGNELPWFKFQSLNGLQFLQCFKGKAHPLAWNRWQRLFSCNI